MTTAVRDDQRARVYRAEDKWALRLDAARRGARTATVAGSPILLPQERLFGTLDAASLFAEQVLNDPRTRARFGAIPDVTLRERRGNRQAHWEQPGIIALPIPVHGQPWAMREYVLLHEISHHVLHHTDQQQGHGPAYTAVMVQLVEDWLGPEAAFALRVDYADEHVTVGVNP